MKYENNGYIKQKVSGFLAPLIFWSKSEIRNELDAPPAGTLYTLHLTPWIAIGVVKFGVRKKKAEADDAE